MNFYSLPKDIQEKILEIAPQYPLTIDEVKELYLIGGDHTDYLCQLKTMNMPNIFIQWENQRLWDEKNNKLWDELKSL